MEDEYFTSKRLGMKPDKDGEQLTRNRKYEDNGFWFSDDINDWIYGSKNPKKKCKKSKNKS